MKENPIQFFLDGKKFFKAKQYDKAEKCFLALIKSKKNFADVYNMLGVIYHAQGEFNQSIEAFEKAIKINPHYTEALLNLAVLYNDLGKYKKATALYARVNPPQNKRKKEKMDPFIKNKIANKHAELGDIYEGIGLYPEAIIQYETALELGPTFLDIHTKLAVCEREMGQYPKALKILQKVLKGNPAYSKARIQLGVTYFATGEKAKAKAAWKEVLKRAPNDESAKMYLKLVEE